MKKTKEKLISLELVHLSLGKSQFGNLDHNRIVFTVKAKTNNEYNNEFNFDFEQYIDGYGNLSPYVDLTGEIHQIESALAIAKLVIAKINNESGQLIIGKIRSACPILANKTKEGREQIRSADREITEAESKKIAQRYAGLAGCKVIGENDTAVMS